MRKEPRGHRESEAENSSCLKADVAVLTVSVLNQVETMHLNGEEKLMGVQPPKASGTTNMWQ